MKHRSSGLPVFRAGEKGSPMIRPISSYPTSEAVSKAALMSVRAQGLGEQTAGETVEQQTVAVRQAAVVALRGSVGSALNNTGVQTAGTYSRPPPSSARASKAPTSSTAQRTNASGAAAPGNSGAASSASASESTAGTSAAAAPTSSGQVDDAQSAEFTASSLLALSAQTIKGDPEATLQKLLQMRDDALAPPASVADLAIATAAAIRISRLVQERYAAEQVAGQPAPISTENRPTLLPEGVKA
jgi:hypothetical protein